nr:hypothetical protein 45 [Burkholderiaceae bacterium]
MVVQQTKPSNKQKQPKNVERTLEDVQVSYESLMNSKADLNGNMRFGASVLVDKTNKETIAQINKAVEEAIEIGKLTKWGGQVPRKLKLPFKDGDEERPGDAAYEGKMYLNAYNKEAPLVVDAQCNKIIDSTEIYSGVHGNMGVAFYPFDVNGSRGIAVALNAFQKTRDDEPLSGRRTANSYFSPVGNTEAANDDSFEEALK